jgi:eukaryotic-like serine/threonine-protein kinase
MIGQVVGNYRIVDRLGDGGMGSVYRAVDRMLDREVAIKVLRPELARQTALVERFRQEAIALARLSHPNIATLHGLEQHGDQLLMIMEYVRGDTLEAIVQRSGRLAWGRACELCVDVLHALDHAHDQGVVHRDIKPANIMLSSRGAVKVMDFGIARLMGRNRQTQFGHAVGTPMYMAPEQLRGHEVDGRTDLYAVAAVLFELVTGRMAFEADSDYSLMMKQLNEPAPPPSHFVPEVPSALDEIVLKAMSKSPDDRYPNAMAFANRLQSLTRVISNPAREVVSPPTRLADDPPRVVVSTPPMAVAASSVAATAETAERPVLETRLAPDLAETRLASGTPSRGVEVAATRLADVAPATSEFTPSRIDPKPSDWLRDWRSYAAVGALCAVAAFGIREFRAPDVPVNPGGGSAAADTTVRPSLSDSLANVAAGASTSDENASTLIIPSGGPPAEDAGQTGGGAGRVDSASSTPPASKKRTPTPPTKSEPVKTGGGDAPVTGGGGSGSTGVGGSSAGTTPVPAPEVVRTPDRVETAAAAREAIRDAIRDVLSGLGDRNGAVAQSVLEGGLTSQWISLAREGRVSVSSSGSPDIDVQGTRASATFDASVNVRSPFGANKRRPARFSAELQRSGTGWRVTSIRPVGSLSLD